MNTVLILPNPEKPAALELGVHLIDLLKNEGFQIAVDEPTAAALNQPGLGRPEASLFEGVDLVLVLGGDGSMLHAARRIYPRQIPLLGINLGQLGFLTTVESNRLAEASRDLRLGKYQIEDRMMLQAEVVRSRDVLPAAADPDGIQGTKAQLTGLNDLVLAKSIFTRMIRLETWIDDEYFTTYPADGLIVATATGSTAYSLSAGGPILDPRLAAILMTPICAHSLYARPVALCPAARIKVQIEAAHQEITLTADGQNELRLFPGDVVQFAIAPYVTKLLRLNGCGVFEALRSRFKEGRI